MISNDLDKAAEAFKKDDSETLASEVERVANKWYGGDTAEVIKKLKTKID